MKINVGAGHQKLPGFINIDKYASHNPDHVLDVEKDKLPFEDNSVDEVVLHHILEHLGDGFLGSTVVLDDRYRRFVSYQPTPLAEIAQVEAGAAGLAGGTGKSEGSKAGEPSSRPRRRRSAASGCRA